MTEPKSPLDALLALIGGLLDGRAPAGAADQVQQAVQDFMAAFRLVPKREFDDHVEVVRDLEAQVEELERRVATLESPPD